jgi:hypothetical protein
MVFLAIVCCLDICLNNILCGSSTKTLCGSIA